MCLGHDKRGGYGEASLSYPTTADPNLLHIHKYSCCVLISSYGLTTVRLFLLPGDNQLETEKEKYVNTARQKATHVHVVIILHLNSE